MSSIDVSAIEMRKAQWSNVIVALQTRTKELNDELVMIQGQLAQLSGAVQACDVLLAGVDVQPEVSTLEHNG
jgi:hypothetical protein